MDIRDVGTRRELFVDHYLVDRIEGQAALRMHPPKREEVVFQVEGAMENACSGVESLLLCIFIMSFPLPMSKRSSTMATLSAGLSAA